MKKVAMVMCLVLAVSVCAAVAPASGTKENPAWTESKAERLVQGGATVRLATEDRAALEGELMRAVAFYNALAVVEATLDGDYVEAIAVSVYSDLTSRYSHALKKVRGGLEVDAADCMGSGVVVSGRFRGFRCNVTSESLEIPSTALVVMDDGTITLEGEPRSIGPIDAQLDVRVTGKSGFAFRSV